MKLISSLIPLLLAKHCNSAFQDEAGQTDFTIATAGHGIHGVTYAQTTSDGTSVLTSSSSPSATAIGINTDKDYSSNNACHLSSRSLTNGSLNWRRNVCSQPNHPSSVDVATRGSSYSSVRHAVYSDPTSNRVYTLDDFGIMRIWNDNNGALVKEIPSVSALDTDILIVPGVPRILTFGSLLMGGIMTKSISATPMDATDATEFVSFFSFGGFHKTTVSAHHILKMANVNASNSNTDTTSSLSLPSIFGIFPHDNSPSSFHIIAGWAHSGITSLSQMASLQISIETNTDGDKQIVLSENCKQLHHSTLSSEATNDIHVSSIEISQNGAVFGTMVKDNNQLVYTPSQKTTDLRSSAPKVTCEHFTLEANIFQSQTPIQMIHTLQCDKDSATALVSSQSGTSTVFQINNVSGGTGDVKLQWQSEEALAFATSAVFLDKGIVKGDDEDDDDEDALIASLAFSSRISSQWQDFQSFISGGLVDHFQALVGGNDEAVSHKDAVFGLNKIAVILSNHFSKVMAIDTSLKGSISWSLDLNPSATWHKIVHGAATSRSSALGQGIHHPHSHEILILSQTEKSVEWRCVDGLRGRIISESTVDISSPIVQVMPIHGHSHASGGCKQNAAVVFEDNTVLVVPNAAQAAMEVSKISDVGLFTHTIDKSTGVFRSMKISSDTAPNGEPMPSGKVHTIGETIFDPKVEKIINVAYPQRNEVVQSPAAILGDDSLLLKYLNPHLCVVVTEATPEFINEVEEIEDKDSNPFYKALTSSKVGSVGTNTQTKKPLGATKPGEEVVPVAPKASTPAPTLFINILDTVSGQILYRVSHSHTASGSLSSGPTNVPVVLSENWIVYAFPNSKSRRTEVGVLTLHEGMIDKHGITAFSSPEQQLTFSSLNSQTPIVLTKTYGVSYPVSAIGVTNTKGGISSKSFILATGVDGRVIKIDRRLLDPRRPSGEPKKSEKKEGLMQYTPLLPLSPVFVESYYNRIEDASLIVSTSANLESQTLILVLGGPDIFFNRLAPSKGFDSLPESFNKLLIMMVVIGLFIVLTSMKRVGDNKFVKVFWS